MWSRLNRMCHDLEPNYGTYLALYFSLALITGWVSFHSRKLGLNEAAAFQHGIYLGDRSHGFLSQVHGSRILFPYLLHYVTTLSGLPVPYVFTLLRLGSIFAAYCAFHVYLKGWFDSRGALIGTLFLTSSVQLTFIDWFEIPTDFVELLVFTLGCLLIRGNAIGPLLVLIAVGTLNRETTVLLVILLLVNGEIWRLKHWLAVAAAGGVFLAVYGGVKLLLGIRTFHYFLDPGLLRYNFSGVLVFFRNLNIYNNSLSWLYMFNIFWVLAPWGLREKPAFIRRSVMAVPLFLFVYLFGGGSLAEPREMIPLYPVLVPAGLLTFFRDRIAISPGPFLPVKKGASS